MFSGKSLHLVERVRQARQAGLKVAAFKHSCDDRYGQTHIVTHDGQRTEAMPIANAGQIPSLAGDADLIVIDEAQFFDDALPQVCQTLANNGVRVIVAGLDMDYLGNPFGPMPALMASAEYVTKVHAICVGCGDLAHYSHRIVDNATIILPGEKESYEPLCRRCYLEKTKKKV